MAKLRENYLALLSLKTAASGKSVLANASVSNLIWNLLIKRAKQPANTMNNPAPANLYGDIPSPVSDEFFQTLAAGAATRIERIVSHGHRSPPGFWYEQAQHEWVAVLKGEAVLRFDNDAGGEAGELRLREGDHVNIPAGRRHRVEWTAPDRETVWLAVFY